MCMCMQEKVIDLMGNSFFLELFINCYLSDLIKYSFMKKSNIRKKSKY